jgi:DNA phosphorothioation-dependent restriction protein DptH
MSARLFESYLVDEFMGWAASRAQPGFRYQFQSPDHTNATRLHNACLGRSTDVIMVDGVELPVVACGATQLVPVLHGEGGHGFSENYISHLRDRVASRTGLFSDSVLLIIHNSKLDTIINSADDVALDGRPWHPRTLVERLQAKVVEQASASRNLLDCLLADQLNYVISEGATVFGFAPLYDAITGGSIQLSKLGLFEDPLVTAMGSQPAQIRRRLEENRELRRHVDFVTENYADQVEDMFRDEFSAKFIREHFVENQDWKALNFSQFKEEMDASRNQALKLETVKSPQGKLNERDKSTTKAMRKDLSVLVELPHDANEAVLELAFLSPDVASSEVQVTDCSGGGGAVKVSVSHAGGKRSWVQVCVPFTGEPLFFTVRLKRAMRAENHQFRCLFLRQDAFYVDGFRNHFLVEPKTKRITLQMEANRLALSSAEGLEFDSEDPQDEIDSARYASVNFSSQVNSSDKIGFHVVSGDQRLAFNVEGAPAEESVTVPLLFDRDRYPRLFHDDAYVGEYGAHRNRLVIDNRECAVVGPRQVLLGRESMMVAERLLHVSAKGTVHVDDLKAIDPTLHRAYRAWFDYLQARGTTPSLVSWGPEYRRLTAAVTQAYEEALSAIPGDKVLTDALKRLLRVGMVDPLPPAQPRLLSTTGRSHRRRPRRRARQFCDAAGRDARTPHRSRFATVHL